MVRFIVQQKVQRPEELKSFTGETCCHRCPFGMLSSTLLQVATDDGGRAEQ